MADNVNGAAVNGAAANGDADAAQLRQSLRTARMRREIAQEIVQRNILESCAYYTEDGRRAVPSRAEAEPPLPGERITVAGAGAGADRQAPFADLSGLFAIQAAARYLADENPYTCGMLGVLGSYVVGTGFSYRVVAREGYGIDKATLQRGQDVIDRWRDTERWWEWETELFRRAHRDGEEGRRFFPKSDRLVFRPIEPEHCVDPPGLAAGQRDWTHGMRHNPDDTYERISYWISYSGDPAKGAEIPADQIDWNTSNVDRCFERGLSDFFVIRDVAPDLMKLLTNVVRGAQVLAAIAWIESQASGTLRSEVQAMAELEAVTTRTNAQGQTEYFQHLKPGSRIRTNAGKTYNPAPLAANTMNFVEIVRLVRQALGVRWSGHEILTGDASNGNYSSMVVAESPFVHRCQEEQWLQSQRHRRTMMRVLRHAEAMGGPHGLPPGFCDAADVAVEPPPIVVRNTLAEAQTNEVRMRLGYLSPQTAADKDGYNYETEQAFIRQARAAGWLPPGEVPAPPVPGATGGATGLGSPLVQSARHVEQRDPFAWLRDEFSPAPALALTTVREAVAVPAVAPVTIPPVDVTIHQTINQPDREPVTRTIRRVVERDAEGRATAIVDTETEGTTQAAATPAAAAATAGGVTS